MESRYDPSPSPSPPLFLHQTISPDYFIKIASFHHPITLFSQNEPWDRVTVRCETENYEELATVMYANHAEQVGADQGEGKYTESVWDLPGRCMIGTAGKIRSAGGSTMTMTQELKEYRPYDDSIVLRRSSGSLLATGAGEVTVDGLGTIAKHGHCFVSERSLCYADQIVGTRTSASGDLSINVTKAANSWGTGYKTPSTTLHSLETALEYIQDDEFVEITPSYVRMRKKPRSEKDKKKGMRA